MKFSRNSEDILNCRIARKKGEQLSKSKEKLSYTTSIENSKTLLEKFGLQGRYSEKSFKVAGVSEAFNQGLPLEADL